MKSLYPTASAAATPSSGRGPIITIIRRSANRRPPSPIFPLTLTHPPVAMTGRQRAKRTTSAEVLWKKMVIFGRRLCPDLVEMLQKKKKKIFL